MVPTWHDDQNGGTTFSSRWRGLISNYGAVRSSPSAGSPNPDSGVVFRLLLDGVQLFFDR